MEPEQRDEWPRDARGANRSGAYTLDASRTPDEPERDGGKARQRRVGGVLCSETVRPVFREVVILPVLPGHVRVVAPGTSSAAQDRLRSYSSVLMCS